MTVMLALLLFTAPPGGNLAPGGVIPTDSAPARDVITLERGACYGTCPIYRVSIDSSGAIIYAGERFVKVKGNRSTKVSPHVFDALAKQFDDADFDHLSVPKDCPQGIETDHPHMTLTRTHSDSVHKVERDSGNACAPKILAELEKAVDEATGTRPLTKCAGHCPQ